MSVPSIRELKRAFSPMENPFAKPTTVEVSIKSRARAIRTGSRQELVDRSTGEVRAISIIHTLEEKDDIEFVKVFAEGVRMAFGLGAAGAKVFQAVLKAYEAEKMTGGYIDSINLMWFDDGLNGEKIGMSERTFNRGLRELLEKDFISPKMPNVYWVNPALFFKGDRVKFVREYHRSSKTSHDLVEKKG